MAGADWEPGPLGIGGGVAEYTNGRGGHRRGEKHSFIFLLKQGGWGGEELESKAYIFQYLASILINWFHSKCFKYTKSDWKVLSGAS